MAGHLIVAGLFFFSKLRLELYKSIFPAVSETWFEMSDDTGYFYYSQKAEKLTISPLKIGRENVKNAPR